MHGWRLTTLLRPVSCAQTHSLLGPAFALGVVPDMVQPVPQPSVGAQCLAGLAKRGQAEVVKTQEMLRAVMRAIHAQLHALAMNFLGAKARAAPALLPPMVLWGFPPVQALMILIVPVGDHVPGHRACLCRLTCKCQVGFPLRKCF